MKKWSHNVMGWPLWPDRFLVFGIVCTLLGIKSYSAAIYWFSFIFYWFDGMHSAVIAYLMQNFLLYKMRIVWRWIRLCLLRLAYIYNFGYNWKSMDRDHIIVIYRFDWWIWFLRPRYSDSAWVFVLDTIELPPEVWEYANGRDWINSWRHTFFISVHNNSITK